MKIFSLLITETSICELYSIHIVGKRFQLPLSNMIILNYDQCKKSIFGFCIDMAFAVRYNNEKNNAI